MPRISTKPKQMKNKQSQDQEDNLFSGGPAFPDIPMQDGYGEPERQQQEEPSVNVQDLLKTIGQLEGRLNELTAQRSVAPYVQMQQPQTPSAPEPINYDNLPDPTLEPVLYAKEITARLTKYNSDLLAYEREQARTQQEQSSRFDDLWTDFNRKYEDYAKDEDLVELAAFKVAKRMRDKGVDVQRYMIAERDKYFQDIVKEIDRIVPKGQNDDGDDGRTAGIISGTDGGASRSSAGRGGAQVPDMLADLREMQRKSGFF